MLGINLGNAYQSQGLYDESINAYKKAVEINPEYEDAWSNLGTTYVYKGLYDESITACKKAIEINSEYEAAWNNLGNAYRNKGLYDKSINAYKKAIEINSEYELAWINLGAAYQDKGLYDESIIAYKKAKEINPTNETINHLLELVKYDKQAVDEGKIRVRHILVCNEATAHDILEQLKKGVPFTQLANDKSICPSSSKGGDLGFFSKGELLPEFEKAVLKIKPGDISDIVKTKLGYHIIQRIN